VGRSRDYRVSLAVADRSAPDHWRLGIELDGAFQSAAPTVIDREAVRDGVLGALGWRVVKVSCIDWLRDPAKALERIERALRG
jgi:very-short-patch-repair endonuclease